MTAKVLALQFMLQYAAAGVHEATGENDGDQINRFQQFADGDPGRAGHPGDSYCLEALTYSLAKAVAGLRNLGSDMPTLKGQVRPIMAKRMLLTASCALSMDDARQRGCWHSLEEIRAGKYLPMPGDWVFFCWNPDRAAGVRAENHVGVIESWHGDLVDTVEGNTTPGTGNDTTNNPGRFGGVYQKQRLLNRFVLGVRALPESF